MKAPALRLALIALSLLGALSGCGAALTPVYSNDPSWGPGVAVGSGAARQGPAGQPGGETTQRPAVTPFVAPFAPPRPPPALFAMPAGWRPLAPPELAPGQHVWHLPHPAPTP